MKMENIKIVHNRDNYWQVIADTEQFGLQEILYEGNRICQCLGYIRDNEKLAKYIVEILDPWNDRKVWMVKHTRCCHYYLNQKIAGRIFYKRYQRVKRKEFDEIINTIETEERRRLFGE